jgi:hypothetical protein
VFVVIQCLLSFCVVMNIFLYHACWCIINLMFIMCCASVQYAFYDDDEQWNSLANFFLPLTSLDPIFFFSFLLFVQQHKLFFLNFLTTSNTRSTLKPYLKSFFVSLYVVLVKHFKEEISFCFEKHKHYYGNGHLSSRKTQLLCLWQCSFVFEKHIFESLLA